MNVEKIRSIAQIMKENGINTVEITEGETVIRMEKQPPAFQEAAAALPVTAEQPAAPQPAPEPAQKAGELVSSPMVGVFYSAPAPGEAAFVQVGSHVHKGDVLCIIEAMKLMNEITAEKDGEIAEICVENGQVVEYGQPLYRMV